jgi:hypothetical protein
MDTEPVDDKEMARSWQAPKVAATRQRFDSELSFTTFPQVITKYLHTPANEPILSSAEFQ